MKIIDSYVDAFRLKWEKFGIGCEAAEEDGLWDAEANGPMLIYYENTLLNWMIRMTSLDGSLTAGELDYLNRLFGSSYTEDDLQKDIPQVEGGSFYVRELMQKLEKLEGINVQLADAFKDALDMACSIVAAGEEDLGL